MCSVEFGFLMNGDGDGFMLKVLLVVISFMFCVMDGGGGVGWSMMNEVCWGWMKNEGVVGVLGG